MLLLLPVSRTAIRWLYDHSTSDQTCGARLLRAVLFIVPLDKAIYFHMLVGWVTLGHAVGHTVSHLINFCLRENFTYAEYGLTVWITGESLLT